MEAPRGTKELILSEPRSTLTLTWRRSSKCDSGDCVEIARQGDNVLMRDSVDPEGPMIVFADREWAAFLEYLQQDATG